jgi:hypothetical protein
MARNKRETREWVAPHAASGFPSRRSEPTLSEVNHLAGSAVPGNETQQKNQRTPMSW